MFQIVSLHTWIISHVFDFNNSCCGPGYRTLGDVVPCRTKEIPAMNAHTWPAREKSSVGPGLNAWLRHKRSRMWYPTRTDSSKSSLVVLHTLCSRCWRYEDMVLACIENIDHITGSRGSKWISYLEKIECTEKLIVDWEEFEDLYYDFQYMLLLPYAA